MDKLKRFQPDKLDELLIQELEIDARQSSIALGAKLSISPPTVLRRIQRLRDARALMFVTLIDPMALGYQTRALMGIKVRAGKVDATVNALRGCRNVQSIAVTYGRYDIILPTFFRNNREIGHFVHQELGRMDIESVETFIILQQIKNTSKQISDGLNNAENVSDYSLDDVDLKLIKELELQPIGSSAEMSRKLGISRQTITSRLKTLQNNGTVMTVTVVDPRVFGLETYALIFAKVQPGKINDAVSALAHDNRIIELGIMSGRFDINLWAAFRDSDEMSEFVRNNLGDIAGVSECEVYIQVGLPQQPSTSVIQHVLP